MGKRRSNKATGESGPRYRNRRQGGPGSRRRMSMVFAVALGWCGVHRFTLGQWQWGLAHIFMFVVSMAVLENTPFGETPWLTVSAIFAYYTAFRWWRMSDEEFAEHYLEPVEPKAEEVPGRYLNGQETTHPKVLSSRARRKLLQEAKALYEDFDYAASAERFEEALDMDLADAESRVLAARCYSLLEDEQSAYRHLRRAVQLRATNINLVSEDAGFAWLRTRSAFAERRRAGFEVPKETALETEPAGLPEPTETILDQLEQLGRLRERGLLDDEEFAQAKRRLLR